MLIKDKNYSNDFLDYILGKMYNEALSKYKYEKAIVFEDYINKHYIFKNYIFISDIIDTILKNIRWKRYGDDIVFDVNNQIFIQDSNAKLYDIYKLIDNGNMLLRPYPIFKNMFNLFQKDIDKYYELYLIGGF